MAVYRAVLTAVQDARPSLLGLWSRNLPVGGALDEKFRWFYLESPSGPANAFLLNAEDGADASRAVGCAGIGVRTFSYRGRELRTALLADLAVDKPHRTALPALTLQRAVRRHTQAAFDLTYGFPNKHALAIHLRIGFHLLGQMERWVLVLRHAAYLRRAIKLPILPAIGGPLLDGARRVARAPRVMRAAVDHRLEMLDSVDGRIDSLWQRAHVRYPITAERTSAFLRWRYLQKPSEKNRIAVLTQCSSPEILAYAVVQRSDQTANLLDLFGASDAAVGGLLDLLADSLRREGCASISIRFLGMPSLAELLATRGFQLRERMNAIIVDPGAALAIDTAFVRDPANWYLTDGDQDT